jgi:hypothetical protein
MIQVQWLLADEFYLYKKEVRTGGGIETAWSLED